jgi:hypothetical protein
MVCSRINADVCVENAGPTAATLIATTRIKTGFKDFGIWLAAHHATEPIDNVNNANAGHREQQSRRHL